MSPSPDHHSFFQRHRVFSRTGRVTAVLAAAASAALVAIPSGAAGATARGAARVTGTAASTTCPWVTSHAPISQRVAQVMSQMSIANEITMVEGAGTSNPYVFYMPGIPSLCIPQLGEEDGPNGVADGNTGVTQLPSGVSLAATFDTSLARQYGQVIGTEELGKGAAVDLGPTINIDRDPRWGRSFEAYTEDPYLNGSIGTSEIEGLQATGEMDQVKHYAAYNQETYRNTASDDVIVSTRVLQEIYLPAFQAAVQQAKAGSVMCSYAMINGDFACNDPYTETTVLRDQWGFPGFVTSDYGALHATTGAEDGTDQEQPFNTYFGSPLQTAVENGTIPRSVLNTMVQRMLTEMFRFNLIAKPPAGSTSATVTTPAHQALGNEVAEDGTTLLKNSSSVLPLSARNGGNVAVIGPSASASPTYGGGGSAYVIPSKTVTPLAGIQAAAGSGTHVSYSQGLPTDTSLPAVPGTSLSPAYPSTGTPYGGSYTGTLTAPETGTYILAVTNNCGCYTSTYLYVNGHELLDNPGTPPVSTYSAAVNLTKGQAYPIKITGASSAFTWGTPSFVAPYIAGAVSAAKSAATPVVVVSDDTESEATDRPSLDLPSAQNELVSAVAAANPHTVVVVDAGAPVAMPWLSQVAGVVDAWYPGQSSGTALASVLFGQTDPSGHLPVTFPQSLSQVPASTTAQFPGNGTTVQYSEGLDVGYRWYDAKNIQPLFPFGYGLSYTRFAYSNLRVTPIVNGTQDAQVSATVTNVGNRAGSDVAQFYVTDPASAGEPPRQLKGFQRVTLAPGRSTRVHFTLTPADTQWFDTSAPDSKAVGGGWSQSAGLYQVYVGDSSALANLPLHGWFLMASTPGDRQVAVGSPSTMTPGKPSTVKVTLTAGGTETLFGVRIALQLPQGWKAVPHGAVLGVVRPGDSPTVSFTVTPPSYAPNSSQVVHATATFGAAQREAGATVTVGS
ncbi:MAG TPA: glycoside hydrolase family 3 C-terminal domain-containing protein [Streptosporangiaceae bacterium]|nr:glycoside hydrolase family 3 C-terminal domain-containing protein [Streptosporangiaceae bacterium]